MANKQKHQNQTDIIAGTRPPLKRSTVNLLGHIIEQALASALTNAQKRIFEQELKEEWQASKQSREDILAAVSSFEAASKEIEEMSKAQQALAWQEMGRQLYMYAAKEGGRNPVAQLITNLYEAKHTLLIKGNPPLSRLAAESYIEMTIFLQGLINEAAIILNPEMQAEMLKTLLETFPSAELAVREQISQSDMLWRMIRLKWNESTPAERTQYIEELREKVLPSVTIKAPSIEATKSAQPPALNISQAVSLVKNKGFNEMLQKLRSQTGKPKLFS